MNSGGGVSMEGNTIDAVAPVRRAALILSQMTVAMCPVEAVCVSLVEDPNRKVICGHYLGSSTNGDGSFIKCGYLE
jgi:hypothetical protein